YFICFIACNFMLLTSYYFVKPSFASHSVSCTVTCFSFSPDITKRIPSRSTPTLVVNPSNILLLEQSCFMVSKLLPMPYPAFVLKGMTVFPARLYCFRKLFIGGGSCIPQVGKPTKTMSYFSMLSIFVFSGGR